MQSAGHMRWSAKMRNADNIAAEWPCSCCKWMQQEARIDCDLISKLFFNTIANVVIGGHRPDITKTLSLNLMLHGPQFTPLRSTRLITQMHVCTHSCNQQLQHGHREVF